MTIIIAPKDLPTEDTIDRDLVRIATLQGQIQNLALRTDLLTAIRIGVMIDTIAEKRMKTGLVEKTKIGIGQKSTNIGLRNMIRTQRGVVPVRRTVLGTIGVIENEEDRVLGTRGDRVLGIRDGQVLGTKEDRLVETGSDLIVENDLEDLGAEIDDDQIVGTDEEVEVHEEMSIEEGHDQIVKIKI